jgi:hypothetical protein
MKCLICPAEIDDTQDFVVIGPQGQKLDDAVNRLRHVSEMGKWTHLTLTCQRAFTEVLLSGHVCPAHKIFPGSISLVDSPRTGTTSSSSQEAPVVLPSPDLPVLPPAPIKNPASAKNRT